MSKEHPIPPDTDKFEWQSSIIKWLGRVLSSFTFGLLIYSLLLSLKRQLPEKMFSEIQLNSLGSAAMWLINHQIAIATSALIVATLGIVILVFTQVFVSSLLTRKAIFIKHFLFEHLSESLMLIAGAFAANGAHQWEFQGQTFIFVIGHISLVLLTLLFSYIYFFVMENEIRIQLRVNSGLKLPLGRFGRYLTGHSEKL